MDLQKAQQLRSDMQDIPTLTISTVSQFNLLPVADQEEILQMHKYDLLLKVAMENGVAVDDYAFRVLDLLENVQFAGAKRGYHYATDEEVERHMTKVVIDRMFLGAQR